MKVKYKISIIGDKPAVPVEEVTEVEVKELEHSIIILGNGQVICRLFKNSAPRQAFSYFNNNSLVIAGFRTGEKTL